MSISMRSTSGGETAALGETGGSSHSHNTSSRQRSLSLLPGHILPSLFPPHLPLRMFTFRSRAQQQWWTTGRACFPVFTHFIINPPRRKHAICVVLGRGTTWGFSYHLREKEEKLIQIHTWKTATSDKGKSGRRERSALKHFTNRKKRRPEGTVHRSLKMAKWGGLVDQNNINNEFSVHVGEPLTEELSEEPSNHHNPKHKPYSGGNTRKQCFPTEEYQKTGLLLSQFKCI